MKWVAVRKELPPDNIYVLVASESTMIGLIFTGRSESTFKCTPDECSEIMLYGNISQKLTCALKVAYWAKVSDMPLPSCAECDKSCLNCHIRHLPKSEQCS